MSSFPCRSQSAPPSKVERPVKYYERQKLKQDPTFRDLVTASVEERSSASIAVLISLLWSLSSLRLTGHSEDTPEVIKVESLASLYCSN